MLRTPYHALLSRADYDELRRHDADLLDRCYWLEERADALGTEAPVRLFYRSAQDKQDHQLAILRSLARRRTLTHPDTDTD